MLRTGKKFSKPAMSRVINGDETAPATPEKAPRGRLDHLLMEKFPEYGRANLQRFITAGYVSVNGAIVKKPATPLFGQENLELQLPPELADPTARTTIIEQARPHTIYEDDHVLVVNKPAGLLSMAKGEYTIEPSLEDYGLLVHRLDRATSGVVILAKDEDTQRMLRRQFQERKTHKTYHAIVTGRPKLDEAKIDLPITRNLKHPTTFEVAAGGKPAETYYKVIKTNNQLSLLELRPITGRTHQLRVHLSYIGHPILGDPVYGKDKNPASRLYLHASSLEITIPGPNGNIRKTFSAPLPPEFENVF